MSTCHDSNSSPCTNDANDIICNQVVPVGATDTMNKTPRKYLASHIKQLFKDSAHVLWMVLKNCLVASFVGTIVTYIFASGNFFTGKSPQDQSDLSFSMAIAGYSSICGLMTVFMTQASLFLFRHFTDKPDKRPNIFKCLWRLGRRAFGPMLLALVLSICLMYGAMKAENKTFMDLKMPFYIGEVINHLAFTALYIHRKRLYREETVEGLTRHRANTTTIRVPPPYYKLFYGSFIRLLALLVPVFVSAGYIQISILLELSSTNQVAVFSVCSFFLKNLVQDVAKRYVLKRKNPSINLMYAVIGLPTVFIDTQIRVALLRANTGSVSVAGMVALGALELWMRFWKMFMIHYKVKTHASKLRVTKEMSQKIVTVPWNKVLNSESQNFDPTKALSSKRSEIEQSFILWKSNQISCYMAAVLADMHAEYIAIGCSSLIYYFFSDHPKYSFMSSKDGAAVADSTSSVKTQVHSVFVQLGVEIFIDFICVMLEIGFGIPLQKTKSMSSFSRMLFVNGAIINIMMCSMIFLRVSFMT